MKCNTAFEHRAKKGTIHPCMSFAAQVCNYTNSYLSQSAIMGSAASASPRKAIPADENLPKEMSVRDLIYVACLLQWFM